MIGKWLAFLHIRLLELHHLPLAALISLDTLRELLATLGYPAVALFIMIESAGIPFPGETMLLLASFYAAVDHRLQIPLVIICAALGAIIGDNLGFLIGKTGGYALVQRYGRYLFLKPHHLQKAQNFFARHGNKTVFLGRFIAVLRAWAAFLAGVNHMHWSTFLFYNAAGGILWAIIYGCLGFFAGRVFHDNFGAVEQLARTLSWTGTALIIVVVLGLFILFRLRRHRHQAKLAHEEHSSEQQTTPTLQETASAQTTDEQIENTHLPEKPAQQPDEKIDGQQHTEPNDLPPTAAQPGEDMVPEIQPEKNPSSEEK